MELRITPSNSNQYPLGGFLIKGGSVKEWLLELQSLEFSIDTVQVFPVPGRKPNTIGGCFVLPSKKIDASAVGKNELFQRVDSFFFIPEKTAFQPFLSNSDKEKLFNKQIHIVHPELGMINLPNPINFEHVLKTPEEHSWYVFKPSEFSFIPDRINGFKIQPVSPEETIKKLEELITPDPDQLKEKPLSIMEKGKFSFLKSLFKRSIGTGGSLGAIEKTGFLKRLESLFSNSGDSGSGSWSNKLQLEFEKLDERNQHALDRLMNMLKNNPDEALKYAIPLDHDGTSRGDAGNGAFDLFKRRSNFSLFGQFSPSSSGGSIDIGDGFNRLSDQYQQTALQLKQQGDYKKAAFVYLKLLKDNYLAATTLEEGKLYEEAATVYLKYVKNKVRAAECYERGNMLDQAIDLYEEMERFEKVGDLYYKQNQLEKANDSYNKAADVLKSRGQYLEASKIFLNKTFNQEKSKATLLEGWLNNAQASSCLKEYLNHFHEDKKRIKEIDQLYSKQVNVTNRVSFLKAVQHEHAKENEFNERLEEIGYEIIAKEIDHNPAIVEELRKFKSGDREISKDTHRYRAKKKK